jgi:hypothetical protein
MNAHGSTPRRRTSAVHQRWINLNKQDFASLLPANARDNVAAQEHAVLRTGTAQVVVLLGQVLAACYKR